MTVAIKHAGFGIDGIFEEWPEGPSVLLKQIPYFIEGDCLKNLQSLPDNCIQCCITSPPYWKLRDYGVAGQVGQEEDLQEYVNALTTVFREVNRVLTKDGTLFLNIGDKFLNKNLVMVGFAVARALQNDGWILRNHIIWEKPNATPESVKDRFTTSYEHVFFFSKRPRYYFNQEAVLEPYKTDISCLSDTPIRSKAVDRTNEVKSLSAQAAAKGKSAKDYFERGGRNKRDVWAISTEKCKEAHFATFPKELVRNCLRAATREGDVVLDPFNGAGTTALVCRELKREYLGFELNPQYVEISERRFMDQVVSSIRKDSSMVFCSMVPQTEGGIDFLSLLKPPHLDLDIPAEPWPESHLAIRPPEPKNNQLSGDAGNCEKNLVECQSLPEWVSPKKAAEILGVTVNRIYQLDREGKLQGVKLSPKILRFNRDDVLRMKGEG